jgi:intein/homing endonuclease
MSNLPTVYQEFIHKSRYSRWLLEEKRRETWNETVARYFNFFEEHLRERCNYNLTSSEREELEQAILNLEVMPSMRCLMTAGEALRRDEIAGFNCAFIAVDSPRAFDEALYILSCGTGVGFSVERQYVNQLPEIAEEFYETDTTIIVADSKIGWAKSFKELISLLYTGQVPKWDLSRVRPAGAPLKVFGGRASGPGPLEDLFHFCVRIFQQAAGRKLQSVECHDIMTAIANTIVVGGVRRCRPKGTLISTRKGLVPIENVKSGDEVLSFQNKYSKVIASAYSGIKKTVKVNTQLGEHIATPEHRFAVLSNPDTGDIIFKEARDLTNNDRLIFCTKEIEGQNTELPLYSYIQPLNRDVNCRDIDINSLYTAEWAWFIGFLHGDGHVNSEVNEVSFAIAPDMPETKDNVIRLAEKLGLTASVSKPKKKDNCFRIRIASRQLALYLSQFKMPNIEFDIPEFVLHGTSSIRYSYIAGILDADGTCKDNRDNRKVMEVCCSIYPTYIKQLRSLLASLGIPSNITHTKLKNKNDRYTLDVIGVYFKDKLNDEISAESEKVLKDYHSEYNSKNDSKSFTITPELMCESVNKDSFSKSYQTKWNCSWYKFTSGTMGTFLPVEVLSVEENEELPCYDLQVEKTETFVADGILNHNSALISLSNLSDDRMRAAKTGNWWETHPYRALANNSACYTEKPDIGVFMREWFSLYESKSGERGIFNLEGAKKHIVANNEDKEDKYRTRDETQIAGVNPCSEILLRSKGLCNLSEVVIRSDDTEEDLKRKVRIAATFGTMQSTLDNYRYLSSAWSRNSSDERLLGVSLSGIMDNALMNGKKGSKQLGQFLRDLKAVVLETNKEWAKKFKIDESTATTCVKPSGTVSQLVDCASGIHPRYSQYYVRTVRADAKDPLCRLMQEQGFPCEPDITKPDSTMVFSFPMKSPKTSVFRNDMSAIDQLECWLMYKLNWTEHTVSITVYVKEDEWLDVAAWVYKNFDDLTGVSFLPHSDHAYRQAPYQEINKVRYDELVKEMPSEIDWNKLSEYESEDMTTATHELSCVAGQCEIS